MHKLGVVLALATVALVAPASGSAAKHRKPCQRPGTHTLAHNSLARVFERTGGPQAGYDTRLFGCLRATGKRVALSDASEDVDTAQSYGHVRLARRFVAWSFEYTDNTCKAACPPGYEPTTYAVDVRDLKRAKTRHASTSARVTAVLVSRRGALVWSQDDAKLYALYGSKKPRLLDSGDYDEGSLALHGDKLTWTHAGAKRSTTLERY